MAKAYFFVTKNMALQEKKIQQEGYSHFVI